MKRRCNAVEMTGRLFGTYRNTTAVVLVCLLLLWSFAPVPIQAEDSVVWINVTESIGVTDSPTVLPPAIIEVSETIGVTDSPDLQPSVITYCLTMAVSGNGTTSPAEGVHRYGEETMVNISAAPAAGWQFVNWTAPAGSFGDADEVSTTFTMPAQAVTVTANFAPDTYTVSFNTEGGTPAPGDITVTYGSTYGTLPTVTQDGYTFNGWFTAASGGTHVTSSTTVTITANQTLYAQWSINQCTISFNSNGGSAVSAITQDYGTAVTAPTAPTKTGYSFVDWYSDEALTSAYTFDTMPAEDITLYAKWTSTDASLSNLTISEGTLIPSFTSSTYSYVASVDTSTASVTVTPTVHESNATVTVNGTEVTSGSPSGAIFLSIGENTITIVVTAESGNTQTYTIYVAKPVLAINIQPQNTEVTVGEPATFTVVYTAFPEPTFQWQMSVNGGKKWKDIPGANTDTFTIPITTSNMSGYQYRVVLTNIVGSVTSNAAMLTVLTAESAPIITSPNNATFTVNKNGSFIVTATGNPTPGIAYSGTLPSNISFIDNGNGTAKLSGKPAIGSEGTYPITFTASNGVMPNATQTFTLIVISKPSNVADVSIRKTGNYDPSTNTITWTLTVANRNQSYHGTAKGIVITDSLVNGTKVSRVSVSNESASYSIRGRTVTIEIPTLAWGSVYTITISIDALVSKVSGKVENTATVTTMSYDPDLTNNSATTWVDVP